MKMIKGLKAWALMLALAVAGVLVPVSAPVMGITCPDGEVVSGNDITACKQYSGVNKSSKEKDLGGATATIINVLIGIVGFLAVVMIIFGGFLYTTSAGDSGKVTKAKNTIMYGVIGLVVALLAFAIVNFVLSSLFGGNK